MNNPLKVGQSVSDSRVFSIEEVRQFAELSGDLNPIHIDPEFAASTPFERNIVHGMLVAGLISGLIGFRLPGPGTIYLAQELQFKAPLFIDETVTAEVTIVDIRKDKPIVKLATQCRNASGEVVLEGEAVVKVPRQLIG